MATSSSQPPPYSVSWDAGNSASADHSSFSLSHVVGFGGGLEGEGHTTCSRLGVAAAWDLSQSGKLGFPVWDLGCSVWAFDCPGWDWGFNDPVSILGLDVDARVAKFPAVVDSFLTADPWGDADNAAERFGARHEVGDVCRR